SVAASAAVLAFASSSVIAAEHKLEISLETGPNHVRNLSVVALAKKLEEATKGRLEVKVFHGASKYKGTNVPTALAQGALDMGMPGTWHLGKFIPEFNMPGLPTFFGRPRPEQYKVWDGEVGKELVSRLEKKLKVKVIGRWFDLGYAQLFFIEKEVKAHADLKGLKVRAPGGAANLARLEAFDAAAIKIAWPDVPQALQRGTVDGVITTHESVRSAKLWDSGLKFALDDNQSFFQYLPIISNRAWSKLPADIQKIIVDTWEANVDEVRKTAHERQDSAREVGAKNGIKRNIPSDADLASARKKLMAGQAALIKTLKIDAALVAKAEAILAK
ncbi:MAG TPA: TRAP transporter substrate-binding protein DctP, partial [Hyphomicrobiaceae bacterium]|nr:TRAP transporter substrate-binding protein DctP [Hyphomicrobiaceae bacterium]